MPRSQFSLRSLFVLTALVAVGCATVVKFGHDLEAIVWFLAVWTLPGTLVALGLFVTVDTVFDVLRDYIEKAARCNAPDGAAPPDR